MEYDSIGDIHGQAEKLVALLEKMGYRRQAGAYRHPSRQALFVGDFIDRGPLQTETLEIVRAMVEAGSAQAVMGNHEFNAIAFQMNDPTDPSVHLRVRNEKNRRQHTHFLAEVGEDSPQHRAWAQWFLGLPLWLETPHIRVVHACWHPAHMAFLKPLLGPGNTLTPELVIRASRKDDPAFDAVEAVCKGLEIDLPSPVSFTDSEGIVRHRTRVKWWDEAASTYKEAALLAPAERAQLPDTPLPPEARVIYDHAKPVFFGHYWLTGTPSVLSSRVACVDYSAARPGHPLVAYRYQGEADLLSANLVSTDPVFAPSAPRPCL